MKYLIQNKYWNITRDYNLDKLLYLLVARPDCIHSRSSVWLNNKNKISRNYDFPAYVTTVNGVVYWYKNNKLHRENNKPAYINNGGYKEYWTNNVRQLNK